MKEEKYTLTRICQCGHKENFSLTKLEAAFELFGDKYWKMPCAKCDKTKADSVSHSTPKIDAALFKVWSENKEYQFLEQDEDLMLAEMENLELLLGAFDDESFPMEKKTVVVNALYTLLFNNIILKDETYTKEELERMQNNKAVILPELQQRKDKILAYKDIVWDYIYKEVEKVLS